MRAQELLQRVVDGDAAFPRSRFGIERIERPQPQDMPRIDRIGIAQPGSRSRSPTAAADAARPAAPAQDVARAGTSSRLSIARVQASRSLRAASSSPSPSPLANCCTRSTQRDATVGAPESFNARVSSTAVPPPASRNHARQGRCAAPAVPGRGCTRIGRDSHGSVAASRGHVPSLSPPSTTRSKSSKRASSGPRIASRFWRL